MRLIDADALIKSCQDEKGVYFSYEAAVTADVVDHAPTVDAVPVVRCGECGAFRPLKEGGLCWNTGYYVPENGYCHDGVRKEGDKS